MSTGAELNETVRSAMKKTVFAGPSNTRAQLGKALRPARACQPLSRGEFGWFTGSATFGHAARAGFQTVSAVRDFRPAIIVQGSHGCCCEIQQLFRSKGSFREGSFQ